MKEPLKLLDGHSKTAISDVNFANKKRITKDKSSKSIASSSSKSNSSFASSSKSIQKDESNSGLKKSFSLEDEKKIDDAPKNLQA